MQKVHVITLGMLLVGLGLVSIVQADVIHLTTGKSVTGKIIESSDKFTKVDVAGVTLTYYPEEVQAIESDNPAFVKTIAKAEIKSNPVTAVQPVVSPDSKSVEIITKAQDQISQDEVKNVLAQIEKAVNTKDFKAMKDLIWDDAKFSLKDTDGGEGYQLAAADYLELAKNMWQELQNYTFHYTLSDITVAGNKAICHGTPQETVTMQDGRIIQSTAQSEDGFEKRNGVVKKIYHYRTHLPSAAEIVGPTALQK